MQSILTQLFIFIAIVSIASLVTNFVSKGVPRTPQSIVVVESPVVEVEFSVASAISYATLEWVCRVEEEVVEMPDIIAIAKGRMHKLYIASLGIRELKKLASDRKLKGYGKMNKAALIAALC